MPLFTSGGFGLVLVILVLVSRIWSCLHHWKINSKEKNRKEQP